MSKIKASEKESKQEKTTNAKKVNTSFWYSGNHIIKIWEQYLKSSDSGIKFYNNNQPSLVTLFSQQNQLSQSIEHAIVTKVDGTPYINHYGESITICGELSQVKKSELPNRLKEIIDQINSYNANQGDKTKITHHTIIFPYQPIGGHWNLGKITFDIKGDKAEDPIISLYEPYGPKYKDRTDKFLSTIKSSELFSVSALGDTAKCQQQKDGDGTSCGAITAENGKEFLIAATKNNTPEIEEKKGELLKKTYAVGAYNLRKVHIDEIDGIDGQEEFLKVQLRNQSYNSNVDKKNVLENHKNVKSLLESTIQKETYSWVSDLLRHMQTSKDSSDEVLRTKLELFRGFIMHHDLDQQDEQSYISPMLLEYNKGDLEWKTGAMELIDSLNIPNQPANSNKGKSVKTVDGVAVGKEDKSQKPNPKTDEKKSKDKKLDIPSQQDKKSVDNKSLPDTKTDVKSKNVETGSITPTTVLSVKKSPVNAEDLKHKLEEYSNKIKDEVKIQQVDSEIRN